jgi:glutathione S-transferase
VPIDIFGGDNMTPEYAAMNPSLTTPVLEVAPGSYLPESNAILLHLSEGTHLLPADHGERAQVYRWLFFEQGAMLPTIAELRFRLLTDRIDPNGEEAERAARVAGAVTGVLERHLQEREYAAADRYTVADIALFGYAHVADEARVDMNGYPAVAAWLERVRGQPGHVEDMAPYPDNARPGKGRSIHDVRTA